MKPHPLPPRRLGLLRLLGLAALMPLGSLPAAALDLSWSGYGTLGYARSNQPQAYERFVSEHGSFKRDSILGLQANAEFSPRWSATLQATLAPSASDDHHSEITLPWAYVSYRAGNDLLLRAGKMRMPMYLYSENMNVGVAYEFVHLPTEVYSTAPTTDYSGLSLTRNWALPDAELSLDAYWGLTRVAMRKVGDGTGGGQQGGDLRTRSGGLMLTLRRDDHLYRAGFQQAYIQVPSGGIAQLPGGGGTNGPGDTAASPGAPQGGATAGSGDAAMANTINTQVILLGTDLALGQGLRLVGELARRHAHNLVTPKNSLGAYVALLKKMGPWTPYLSAARLLSDREARRSANLGGNNYDDQSSWALGTAYTLTPQSRLKGEWARIHVRDGSSLVDAAADGSHMRQRNIHILSLSYHRSF